MMVHLSGVSSVFPMHLRFFQGYFQLRARELVFGCACLLLAAASPVCSAQVLGVGEHGAWTSLVMFTDERGVTRASVGQENHGRLWLFSLDSPLEDCQTIDISLWAEDKGGALLSSAYKSGTLGVANGQVRVDERGTYNFVYVVFPEDSGVTLTITYADDHNQLIDDIDNGNVIRFKLRFGDEEFFVRFPLNGARAAIDRQDLLCRQLQLQKADELYFSPQLAKPD